MKFHIASVALSLSALTLSNASAAPDTLAAYLDRQGMIKVPTSLQNMVLPGSLLIVRYHGNRPIGTQPYRSRIDFKEPTFQGNGVAGEEIDNTAFQGSGGAILGLLAPSVALKSTQDVHYDQTEFATTEWDAGDIDDLLEQSTLTQNIIKRFAITGSNPLQLDDDYQVFVVESVFAASSVHLTTSSDRKLELRNNSLSGSCAAKATPLPVHNQPGAPVAIAPVVGVPVGPYGADAKPAADPAHPTSPANAVPYYRIHVELCSDKAHSYYLDHTPPVALGMRVLQVKYRDGVLEANTPDNPRDPLNIK